MKKMYFFWTMLLLLPINIYAQEYKEIMDGIILIKDDSIHRENKLNIDNQLNAIYIDLYALCMLFEEKGALNVKKEILSNNVYYDSLCSNDLICFKTQLYLDGLNKDKFIRFEDINMNKDEMIFSFIYTSSTKDKNFQYTKVIIILSKTYNSQWSVKRKKVENIDWTDPFPNGIIIIKK